MTAECAKAGRGSVWVVGFLVVRLLELHLTAKVAKGAKDRYRI